MRPTQGNEPLGAAIHEGDGCARFTLLSRGDRVHGRLLRPRDPAPCPLIVIATSDGLADGPAAQAVLAAWSEWAAVAALDLPLCGARTSDKLSIASLDAGDALADRLRADLQVQVKADLSRCFAFLAGELGAKPERSGLACAGIGADLATGFCGADPEIAAVALSPRSTEDTRELKTRLGERLAVIPGEPPDLDWLCAAGEFLARRLGAR